MLIIRHLFYYHVDRAPFCACFWRVVVSVFWLFLGIVNCILLLNRVTPFTGPDLHMLTDGIAIMQKYLPFYGVVIGCIIIGLVLFALLILFIKGPKYQQKIKYRYVIPMIVVGAVAFGGITSWLFLKKRVLSNYFGNIALLMKIMDILIVWQLLFLIRVSVSQEITQRKKLSELRRQSPIFRKPRKMEKDRIFCFFSWNPSLILHCNYLNISDDPIPNLQF